MKLIFLLLTVCTVQLLASQSVTADHFPAVTAEMLKTKSYAIQPDAAAVVLAEAGSTRLMDENTENFVLEFTLHRRIHILKNSAYKLADLSEELFQFDDIADKFSDLKAVTYNLENNVITESKLNSKTAVFTERISPRKVLKKFALTNVREGSIIDFEYKIRTTYLFALRPWDFQGEYPVLWSSYKVAVPEFLDYILLTQGLLPFKTNTISERLDNFSLQYDKEVYHGRMEKERVDITAAVADYEWTMENVPAFREEPFTSSPQNYINRLRFQLAGFKRPLTVRTITPTWPDFMITMLKGMKLEEEVEKTGEWWPADIKEYLKGASTETDIAKAVYNYVQAHFSVKPGLKNGLRTSLKKIAAEKGGTQFEINLVLVAMLRHIGLKADPVILSTRSNGYLTEAYPVEGELNYLICRVQTDADKWLLDASVPWLGFGKLNTECYNGTAIVVNPDAEKIKLNASQITETTVSAIDWRWDAVHSAFVAEVKHQYGYFASGKLRETMKKGGNEEIRKLLLAELPGYKINDDITSADLDKHELPVTLTYRLEQEPETNSAVYLKPVITWQFKQNPFNSPDRLYAVELPYRISQLYTATVEIPDGYIADEMPSSKKITMNDRNDAVFSYEVKQSGNKISIACLLEINKTEILVSEYQSIRNFFTTFTGVMESQIVLKKK